MKILQLTPGAGAMYCGNCLRDNALVGALRALGHEALMVPLYLPLTLDEDDLSREQPVFFSGVNVYLDHKLAWFRRAPAWLRRGFAARGLLRRLGRHAAKTRAAEVGDLTLSMLRGEHGNQARDLEELVAWLKTQPRPDAICLSNALLLGLAGGLRAALGAPVVCFLAGEDAYVDEMPEPLRSEVWDLMAERARDAALFVAPSRYFAERMARRLHLPPERVAVVPTGINLDGFPDAPPPPPVSPTVGYLARMGPMKGLDTLVGAFMRLRQAGRVRDARLEIAGSCGPADETFVREQRARLAAAGCADGVAFHPNLDRGDKIAFLRRLSVFSVPATYGEAFGLYLIEAWAAGVPVVQPRHAAFPELIETTGGGLLCEPNSEASLAQRLEELLLDEPRRARLAALGHPAVRRSFTAEASARQLIEHLGAQLAG